MRWLLLLAPLFINTGCAIPIFVTLGSTTMDAIMMTQTNKDFRSHIVSAINKKDCRLERIFHELDMCDAKSLDSVGLVSRDSWAWKRD